MKSRMQGIPKAKHSQAVLRKQDRSCPCAVRYRYVVRHKPNGKLTFGKLGEDAADKAINVVAMWCERCGGFIVMRAGVWTMYAPRARVLKDFS
jgi:hypothetical protein